MCHGEPIPRRHHSDDLFDGLLKLVDNGVKRFTDGIGDVVKSAVKNGDVYINNVRIEGKGKQNIEIKGDKVYVNGKRVSDGRKHHIHVKVIGKEIYVNGKKI